MHNHSSPGGCDHVRSALDLPGRVGKLRSIKCGYVPDVLRSRYIIIFHEIANEEISDSAAQAKVDVIQKTREPRGRLNAVPAELRLRMIKHARGHPDARHVDQDVPETDAPAQLFQDLRIVRVDTDRDLLDLGQCFQLQ